MQGSKTVPPTYKRRGRDRARWRTGSAKCVRQHKEKNWFMRMCIHILKCISESDNRLSISTNWHSVYLAHTWIDYIHTRTHSVARPLVLLFCLFSFVHFAKIAKNSRSALKRKSEKNEHNARIKLKLKIKPTTQQVLVISTYQHFQHSHTPLPLVVLAFVVVVVVADVLVCELRTRKLRHQKQKCVKYNWHSSRGVAFHTLITSPTSSYTDQRPR